MSASKFNPETRRTLIERTAEGVSPSGASRLAPSPFGSSRPVEQAVFYTEFDGRRPNRLVIKVLGE